VSRALVPTSSAARYGKQLAAHLGHRIPVEADPDTTSWRVRLDHADGRITATSEHLLLEAAADDGEALATLQGVLGEHLERFGRREDLVVTWQQQC
jgi:hypothetical protein